MKKKFVFDYRLLIVLVVAAVVIVGFYVLRDRFSLSPALIDDSNAQFNDASISASCGELSSLGDLSLKDKCKCILGKLNGLAIDATRTCRIAEENCRHFTECDSALKKLKTCEPPVTIPPGSSSECEALNRCAPECKYRWSEGSCFSFGSNCPSSHPYVGWDCSYYKTEGCKSDKDCGDRISILERDIKTYNEFCKRFEGELGVPPTVPERPKSCAICDE